MQNNLNALKAELMSYMLGIALIQAKSLKPQSVEEVVKNLDDLDLHLAKMGSLRSMIVKAKNEIIQGAK